MKDNFELKIEIGVLIKKRNINFGGPIHDIEPTFINEDAHKRFVDNLLKAKENVDNNR